MRPVVEVERHNVLSQATFALVEARIDWGNRRRSSGWGREANVDTATDKAISEAVERHCYRQLPPAAIRATAAELAGCLEPGRLVRYLPPVQPGRGFAVSPYDPAEQRLWLPVVALHSGAAGHVLADFVCHPSAFEPADRERLVTLASTSGCACAYTHDEAVLRASLEAIERDAFMRHWFAQTPGETIVPATLPEPIRERLERLVMAGCEVGVQCLFMGLHPTWLAWAQHRSLAFTCVGSASGLEARAALDTALNELETMTLARLEGVPAAPIAPRDVKGPADHAALYATPAYFRQADALWHGVSQSRSFADASVACATAPQALYCRAARAGHPLYEIDLTVPEARGALNGRTIHCVRVVGVELIPMCFGFGHLPLGMDRWHRADPEALHPFA